MDKLLAAGENMGLEGEKLKEFVTHQQAWERAERARALEERKRAAEVELEQKKMELKIARIQSESVKTQAILRQGKPPKLSTFVDGTDELDLFDEN